MDSQAEHVENGEDCRERSGFPDLEGRRVEWRAGLGVEMGFEGGQLRRLVSGNTAN